MANLTIQNEDLLATLQAQRNEAWDAAARAGAACAAAGRRIDDLEKELEAAKQQIASLEATIADLEGPLTEDDVREARAALAAERNV